MRLTRVRQCAQADKHARQHLAAHDAAPREENIDNAETALRARCTSTMAAHLSPAPLRRYTLSASAKMPLFQPARHQSLRPRRHATPTQTFFVCYGNRSSARPFESMSAVIFFA
jgi:hypothetical protein